MTDLSKDELLKRADEQYTSYEGYWSRLSEAQLTELVNADGWSVKDYLYHLALAEGTCIALLNRQPIWEFLGVDLQTYLAGDDSVNAVIQKRSHLMPLSEVLDTLKRNHQRLMELIRATPEADLQRPFNDYQPASTPREGTVMQALINNTFHHYEEHVGGIVEILESGAERMPKTELLERINQGFQAINTYLDSLSEAQLTQPTDAAGWTAKDHVIHLATWEDSILALLSGAAQWEHMGIEREVWKQGEDPINAVIQQRNKAMPLADVRRTFNENHQRVLDKLQSMNDEDLHRPYNYYQPKSTQDKPVIRWIQGNTYQHFEAHQPWIAAIVNS